MTSGVFCAGLLLCEFGGARKNVLNPSVAFPKHFARRCEAPSPSPLGVHLALLGRGLVLGDACAGRD